MGLWRFSAVQLQGHAMAFEVDITADLSDGLQVSELVGTGIVFEFNRREVGTGRYHPRPRMS